MQTQQMLKTKLKLETLLIEYHSTDYNRCRRKELEIFLATRNILMSPKNIICIYIYIPHTKAQPNKIGSSDKNSSNLQYNIDNANSHTWFLPPYHSYPPFLIAERRRK